MPSSNPDYAEAVNRVGRPNIVMNEEQINKVCDLLRHGGYTLFDVAKEMDINVATIMKNFHSKPEYLDKLLSAQDDRRTIWRDAMHHIAADSAKDTYIDKDGNEHERHVPSKRADIRTKCLQWDFSLKHVDVASVLSGMRKFNPMTSEEKLARVESALAEGRIDTEAAEKILSVFERSGKIREQLVLKDRLEALEAKMNKPSVTITPTEKKFDRDEDAAALKRMNLKAEGKWDYARDCPLEESK